MLEADHPQGHSAAGRIMSIEISSDTVGNRTRDRPACSAVPQPTAPLRTFWEMEKTQNELLQLAMTERGGGPNI